MRRSDRSNAQTHRWVLRACFAGILVLGLLSLLLGACTPNAVSRNPATAAVNRTNPIEEVARSVAVMPFTQPNAEPDTNWFSDGITRELTRALGRNATLRVTAWHSAARYRDSAEPPAAIGNALHADFLLRGTLLRRNDQIVLFAELIDARSGRTVWSNSFSNSYAAVPTTEAHIAQNVAVALHVTPARTHATPTIDPRAHDLLLEARAVLWSAHSAKEAAAARRLLEKAIALAPGYAEARAVLAQAWMDIVLHAPMTMQQAAALPQARAEAQRALVLDPDNFDALYALGNADFNEHDPQQARIEYARAAAVDPSDALVHMALGDLATSLASVQQQFAIAAQLDPFNAAVQNNLADAWLDLGRYRRALPAATAYWGLQPRNIDADYLLALNESLLHDNQAAVNAFNWVPPRSGFYRQLASAGRLAYRSILDPKLRPKALAAVDALKQWSSLDPTSTADLFQAELVVGEKNAVLAELPGLCSRSPISCADLGSFPLWLTLHGTPSFEALVKKYDTTSQSPLSASPPQ